MLKMLLNLESIQGWDLKIKSTCRENGLKLGILNSLSICKLKNIYNTLEKNYFTEQNEDKIKENTWCQKQKITFPFVLIILSLVNGKLIRDFATQEYSILKDIFKFKSRLSIQYEAMLLIQNKQLGKRKWDQNQEKILTQLVKQKIFNPQNTQNKMKWKQISKKLFQISQFKYFRMGKACRQKWFNHLDPLKKHGQWQQKQDIIIIQYVFNKGKKWSQISKLLQNRRTQHMIKNRYKSLLIHHKKKTNKNGKQQKLLFSLAKNLGIKQKIKDCSCKRRKYKQINIAHQEEISINEQISQQSQSVIQNYNIKIQQDIDKEIVTQKKKQIKRQYQPQNNMLNNFSSFFYLPGQNTVKLAPYYINNTPSVPIYFNNFNNFLGTQKFSLIIQQPITTLSKSKQQLPLKTKK